MKDQKLISKKIEESYNDLPYKSYPFAHACPEHMYTIGKLFGIDQMLLNKARVLEIGCSDGGNLVNFALNNPEAYCVGIDIAQNQIEIGLKRNRELGIENIELKCLSVDDLDESIGKFDYIITHGVYSWVPEFVREKIFEVSSKLLSPTGIAYISYNTLPGWNMMNTIRDMMLFHSSIFTSTKDKLDQSKLFLSFVTQALENSQTPYAEFLRSEVANIQKMDDHYLRHEYLAEENKQFYFNEIFEKAAEYNLSYLAEANFQSMYTGNLPAKAIQKIAEITDIARTEQYIDFINNRRFRCTLFCHSDTKIDRNISFDHLTQFYYLTNLKPSIDLKDIDINDSSDLAFKWSNQDTNALSTTSAVLKAIFYTLWENLGNPIDFDYLIKSSKNKCLNSSEIEIKGELEGVLGKLVFGNFIKILGSKPKVIAKVSSKPTTTKFARYQAKLSNSEKNYLTNSLNELVAVSIYEKFIVELLDGKHSIKQIEEAIFDKLKSGQLVANNDSTTISDESQLKDVAAQCVNITLEKLRVSYLLTN